MAVKKKSQVVKSVVVEETRGRKKNPREIQHNGLFKDQNSRIVEIAKKEGIDAAVVVRRIVDWYFDAKEAQESKYSNEEEFNKLKK